MAEECSRVTPLSFHDHVWSRRGEGGSLDNHRRSTTLSNIRDSKWEMDDFDSNNDADFSQEGASECNAKWEELDRPL